MGAIGAIGAMGATGTAMSASATAGAAAASVTGAAITASSGAGTGATGAALAGAGVAGLKEMRRGGSSCAGAAAGGGSLGAGAAGPGAGGGGVGVHGRWRVGLGVGGGVARAWLMAITAIAPVAAVAVTRTALAALRVFAAGGAAIGAVDIVSVQRDGAAAQVQIGQRGQRQRVGKTAGAGALWRGSAALGTAFDTLAALSTLAALVARAALWLGRRAVADVLAVQSFHRRCAAVTAGVGGLLAWRAIRHRRAAATATVAGIAAFTDRPAFAACAFGVTRGIGIARCAVVGITGCAAFGFTGWAALGIAGGGTAFGAAAIAPGFAAACRGRCGRWRWRGAKAEHALEPGQKARLLRCASHGRRGSGALAARRGEGCAFGGGVGRRGVARLRVGGGIVPPGPEPVLGPGPGRRAARL